MNIFLKNLIFSLLCSATCLHAEIFPEEKKGQTQNQPRRTNRRVPVIGNQAMGHLNLQQRAHRAAAIVANPAVRAFVIRSGSEREEKKNYED